jgi:hypothetical protein
MKKIYLLLLIIALLPLGCGKDEVQPSLDSVITLNALDAVNAIKEAYQEKDRLTLARKVEMELSDEISEKLGFETAELSFSTPRMVRISDPDVMVLLNWQGKWEVNGRIFRDRGTSTLVFNIDSMKLVRIEGSSPFDTPGIK